MRFSGVCLNIFFIIKSDTNIPSIHPNMDYKNIYFPVIFYHLFHRIYVPSIFILSTHRKFIGYAYIKCLESFTCNCKLNSQLCVILKYTYVTLMRFRSISRHWPLWGKSTGDRWIPLTKGQWRRKCFHLITSSWVIICWREKSKLIAEYLPSFANEYQGIIMLLIYKNIYVSYRNYYCTNKRY